MISLRHLLRIGALALALGSMVSWPAPAAEVVFPPASRIGLVPPAGWVTSKTFQGFEDSERKVAVAVAELPAPAYADIEKTFKVDLPSQQQITIEKRESLPFAKGTGFLVISAQEVGGTRYRKWLFAAPAGDITLVVSVQMPEAARATYSDAIVRAALASVTLRDPPIAEQLAMLPFKLSDMAGFRLLHAMPAGAAVLTDGPKSDNTPEQSYIIISIGAGGPQDANERANFARQLMASSPTITELRVTANEAMRIGGQPGHELRAEGKDVKTGVAVNVVQWMKFAPGAYLRVVGITRKETWNDVFPRFRAVRDGIEGK